MDLKHYEFLSNESETKIGCRLYWTMIGLYKYTIFTIGVLSKNKKNWVKYKSSKDQRLYEVS